MGESSSTRAGAAPLKQQSMTQRIAFAFDSLKEEASSSIPSVVPSRSLRDVSCVTRRWLRVPCPENVRMTVSSSAAEDSVSWSAARILTMVASAFVIRCASPRH